MSYTWSLKPLDLIKHIDLPDHDGVVKIAEKAHRLHFVVRSFSYIGAPLTIFLVLWFLNKAGDANISYSYLYGVPLVTAAVMVISAGLLWVKGKTTNSIFNSVIFFVVAVPILVVAVLGGAFANIGSNDDAFEYFAMTLVAAGASVIGVWLSFLFTEFMMLVARPLNNLLFGPIYSSMRRTLHKHHKAWIGLNGRPILNMSVKRGFYGLRTRDLPDTRVYVFDSSHRNNGKAKESGRAVYTYDEVLDGFNMKTVTIATGLVAAGTLSSDVFNPGVNPATGLPTIEGSGSVDIAGNTFGTSNSGGSYGGGLDNF